MTKRRGSIGGNFLRALTHGRKPIYPSRIPVGMPPSETDPSTNQSGAEIEEYYRNVKVGDPAAIRETQRGLLRFTITTIEGVNSKLGRVYLPANLAWGGKAFYMKSGKNCFSPNGQSNLVVPTDEVSAWVAANPGGSISWTP
jgi:hypothetical protein